MLFVTPDVGVVPDAENAEATLYARVAAAAATAELLMEHGLEPEVTPADVDEVNALAHSLATNPARAEQKFTPAATARMTPAALLLAKSVLHEFGHAVVESALHIRHVVTNKLLIETENPDPRVRIRALELLGKISDVGLFTERSEVTVTHQSTDDLRQKLREKFEKLRDKSLTTPHWSRETPVSDAEIIRDEPDTPRSMPLPADFPDVESELGLK